MNVEQEINSIDLFHEYSDDVEKGNEEMLPEPLFSSVLRPSRDGAALTLDVPGGELDRSPASGSSGYRSPSL